MNLDALPQVLENLVPVLVIGLMLGAIALGARRYQASGIARRQSAEPPAGLLRLALLLRRLPDPIEMLRNRRRARVRALPVPQSWRRILETNVPLYRALPEDERRELERRVQVLLAEKSFEGCDGLTLTDEMRLTIAAHAALLLHGDEKPRYYPGLATILVYPTAYEAPVEHHEGGIVTEHSQGRLGESWRSGVVVLAWDAVRAGGRDGSDGENVVLHEFAHQLDTEDGSADGVPYLQAPGDYRAWARVLAPEYQRLRNQPETSALNEYGATNPAEFFAVATEAFFEKPHLVQERHPALYQELSRLYRLDPARLVPVPTSHEPAPDPDAQPSSAPRPST